MNTEILEKLMKENKIKSYLKLSEATDIPYTTLLDLAHGKVLKTLTIKTLADYFNVSLDLLTDQTTYYNVIEENNHLSCFLPLKKEEQNHLFYLLKN